MSKKIIKAQITLTFIDGEQVIKEGFDVETTKNIKLPSDRFVRDFLKDTIENSAIEMEHAFLKEFRIKILKQ